MGTYLFSYIESATSSGPMFEVTSKRLPKNRIIWLLQPLQIAIETQLKHLIIKLESLDT